MNLVYIYIYRFIIKNIYINTYIVTIANELFIKNYQNIIY